MDRRLTLTIPDDLYRQAEQRAHSEDRPIADVFYDALAESFLSIAHIHPKREQMEQEQAAFQRMLPELLASHAQEYVAIHHGQLVDHDKEQIALVTRVDAAYPQEVVLIKQVKGEPDKVLHMRSPRLLKL